MIKKLLTQPAYLLLLPVFFIVHACTEHWLFINAGEITILLLRYLVTATVLFLLCLLIYRNKLKAGLLTLVILLLYFFFAAFHEFLKEYSPVPLLSKYTFLLPFLLILLIYLAIKIYRSTSGLQTITRYANVLFLILLLTDAGIWIYRVMKPGAYNRISIVNPVEPATCAACSKPDIYFLVFDEYASSISLKEQYGYDNSDLDTFFINHGFTVQAQSKSNYNWTEFSMASILNMSYLQVPRPHALTFADYVHAGKLIGQSKLAGYLTKEGYRIENYSPFNFGGQKAALENNFMPHTTTLITDRTLENVLLKDIGWHFFTARTNWVNENKVFEERFNNILKGVDLLKKSAMEKSDGPRFIYGHLLLPHAPFYMKKMQRETNVQKLKADGTDYAVQPYLENVYYTNTVIRDLCTTIQQYTGGRAIIIVMGDHGFRKPTANPYPSYFQNMNAVYWGGNPAPVLPDSITGVNQFRVVLNSLFKQSIPLLTDTCIYLKDE